MTSADMFVALVCIWLAITLVVLLSGLRSTCPSPFTALKSLGRKIMSVIDEAIARFTSFTQGVLAQLKGAKESNDVQTAKLAELQAALDVALSDDAADKAAITSLQAEISTLQDSVAAQINAAVDSLQNPPSEVPAVEEPVVEEPVVEEVPVVVEEPVVEGVPVEEVPAEEV